jgi:hypothetical protein
MRSPSDIRLCQGFEGAVHEENKKESRTWLSFLLLDDGKIKSRRWGVNESSGCDNSTVTGTSVSTKPERRAGMVDPSRFCPAPASFWITVASSNARSAAST